jgi:hypothetical protein
MKKKGRPRGQPLDPGFPSSVILSETDIDDRWRLRMPSEITKGLDWLTEKNEAFDVLGVLRQPGVVAIWPWVPHGERVVARRRHLEELSKTDSTVIQALKELRLLYVRLTLGGDAMITLSPEVLFHLRVTENENRQAMVLRTNDDVEIWGAIAKDRAAISPDPLLADLP